MAAGSKARKGLSAKEWEDLRADWKDCRERMAFGLALLNEWAGKLIDAADEIEFLYRDRGLNAIKENGKENPVFTDLFRALERAKEASGADDDPLWDFDYARSQADED
jgi:hypothetical protein